MENEGLRSIPNIFYDLIVFVTPTLIFWIGIYAGLFEFAWFPKFNLTNIDLVNLVWVVLIGLLASYEYGRIAEAWSSTVVQSPMKFLNRHLRWFKNPDFARSPVDVYIRLGLPGSHDGRAGDKWVVYFLAFAVHPSLGADLLKRYAWEKLARSSAFTYVVLLLASIITLLIHLATGSLDELGSFGFGTAPYSVIVTVMVLITYIEYYRRNVWNFDLLMKTVPVILEAKKIAETDQDRNMTISLRLPFWREGRRKP